MTKHKITLTLDTNFGINDRQDILVIENIIKDCIVKGIIGGNPRMKASVNKILIEK